MGFKAKGKSPAMERWWSLTDRQRELALMMMSGKLNRDEMAEELGIGLKTVDSHRLTLLAGLELQNAVQLVHFGIQNGLIKVGREPY